MPCKRIIVALWLPAALTALLVALTFAFNGWLDIDSAPFFWRCFAATLSLGIIIFFPAVFFTKRRARYLYALAVSLLVSAIFISQFLYYRYSGGFLQASSLGYSGQALDLLATIKTLLSYKMLFFIIPPIVVAFGYFFERKYALHAALTVKEKPVALVVMIIIICGGYGILLHQEQRDFGSIGGLYNDKEMYNLSSLVAKAGIVNFYIESLVEYVARPRVASAADTAFLAQWAAGRALPPHGNDFGTLKGRNLIFIQMESMENWVIGYSIDGQEVAPNLTALAGEGTYFTDYHSQDGVGNTADAEFSTLNSLYPLPDSVAFISHAQNQYAALPSLLDAHGYTTAVMHGDVASFWNRSNAYPGLGYQNIFSKSNYTIPRVVGTEGLGDDDFFKQSLPKLEALPKPFMATLITLSTHTPFTLPKDLQTLVIPKNTALTPTQQLYVQAVHYSDQALGTFIAGLKADGLYNNSLIVIYGDHSAFIGTPDSSMQHVPLIILAPNSNLAVGQDATPGSHLDLYPTVADLLGVARARYSTSSAVI